MNVVNLFSFFSLMLISIPAMAYIDPASGSAIMSAIIGLFVAIGIAIKTYWYKLKSLITGKKNAHQEKEEIKTTSEE